MENLSFLNPLYSISGLLVGILVGTTGVGGGSLMTPLLILLFGIHPETAVGTDLLFAFATKSAGTVVHGIAGSVDWKIVRRLALGSLPGAMLALGVLSGMGPWSAQVHAIITTGLAIALFLTVLSLLFRKTIENISAKRSERTDRRTFQLTVLTGFVLGVLVSISSVGAGALGVTALIFLHPRLPVARIVGSDIAHAVPLTLVAGLGHFLLGGIDWALLASLLVGSIPGILFGSSIAARIPKTALRLLLAAVLGLVATRLLVS